MGILSHSAQLGQIPWTDLLEKSLREPMERFLGEIPFLEKIFPQRDLLERSLGQISWTDLLKRSHYNPTKTYYSSYSIHIECQKIRKMTQCYL